MRTKRLLLLLAMALQAHAWSYSALSESDSFRAASEMKVFQHTFGDQWKGARLKVSLHVERGGASVRLIDASGAIRLVKAFGPGDVNLEEKFDGKGLWRVELRLRRATGRYSIKLTGV